MDNERTSAIYALYDTRDGAIRYIGRTVQPLKLRRQVHMAEGRHTHLPCHRDLWIREVEATGGTVAIREVDRVPVSEAPQREREWIERLTAQGAELVNTFYCRGSKYQERQLSTTRIFYPGCGADFRAMRHALGMSAARLAHILGYRMQTVYIWEREQTSIPRYAFERVQAMTRSRDHTRQVAKEPRR